MGETLEIIPGESIGRFKLGMTRQEIEGLNIEPMELLEDDTSHHFSLQEVDSQPRSSGSYSGVTVQYDASGRVSSLTARFGYSPFEPPVFTLFGEVVNGMTDGRVGELLRSKAGADDVEYVYGSVSSASAGLSAVKWEAIDDEIMCIEIMPKG
jgi:hypothetical protein